jgi:hypothetical protein
MTTDTARLRELLAKATPGPWYADTSTPGEIVIYGGERFIGNVSARVQQRMFDLDATNAALIAEAINALPGLLDEVDRLRNAVAREIAAWGTYLATPQDRGGSSGPKGQARAAWMEARSAVVAALQSSDNTLTRGKDGETTNKNAEAE